MHFAHQWNSSDAQASVQIGSWSFNGVPQFLKKAGNEARYIQRNISYKYCSKLGVFITKGFTSRSFRANLLRNEDLNLFGNPGGEIFDRRMRTHVRAYLDLSSDLESA